MHKFHENRAAVELIDLFVKYFIINCANRIEELLKTCEEELCRIEELNRMPTSDEQIDPLHFKVLINIIKRLYEADTPHLKKLAEQFFCIEFVRFLNLFVYNTVFLRDI